MSSSSLSGDNAAQDGLGNGSREVSPANTLAGEVNQLANDNGSRDVSPAPSSDGSEDLGFTRDDLLKAMSEEDPDAEQPTSPRAVAALITSLQEDKHVLQRVATMQNRRLGNANQHIQDANRQLDNANRQLDIANRRINAMENRLNSANDDHEQEVLRKLRQSLLQSTAFLAVRIARQKFPGLPVPEIPLIRQKQMNRRHQSVPACRVGRKLGVKNKAKSVLSSIGDERFKREVEELRKVGERLGGGRVLRSRR